MLKIGIFNDETKQTEEVYNIEGISSMKTLPLFQIFGISHLPGNIVGTIGTDGNRYFPEEGIEYKIYKRIGSPYFVFWKKGKLFVKEAEEAKEISITDLFNKIKIDFLRDDDDNH